MNKLLEFKSAARKAKYPYCLTDYPEEDLAEYSLLLTEDKSAGCAITPDNELVNLFNTGYNGQGKIVATLAIMLGASKLNCFDGYLREYYETMGFREVLRVPFDSNLAPKDWDYANNGKPDVIYMELVSDTNNDLGTSKGIL